MKPSFYIILLLSIFVLLNSCGKNTAKEKNLPVKDSITEKKTSKYSRQQPKQHTEKKDSGIAVSTFRNFDNEAYSVDTILNLKDHKLVLAREKINVGRAKSTEEDKPIIIHIVTSKDDSVIFKKIFEENYFTGLVSFNYLGKTSHYLSLMTFGGGSGYLINMYKVNPDNEPHFIRVCQYTELAWCSFNKEGSELLVLQGIWNFDEEETHFGEHKYEIFRYELSHETPKEIVEGTTKNKYPSLGEGISSGKELIKLIQEKEPEQLKKTDLAKYPFE